MLIRKGPPSLMIIKSKLIKSCLSLRFLPTVSLHLSFSPLYINLKIQNLIKNTKCKTQKTWKFKKTTMQMLNYIYFISTITFYNLYIYLNYYLWSLHSVRALKIFIKYKISGKFKKNKKYKIKNITSFNKQCKYAK